MKKIIFIILILFPILVFSQQKNIIGIHSGYEYCSDGIYYQTMGSNYKPKEHGFTIGTNYERLLKNNWSVGGNIDYSGLFSKSGNFGFKYWKDYKNIIGLSFKTSKYFGNKNKFYGVVSWGLFCKFSFYTRYFFNNNTETAKRISSDFKHSIWEYPLFAELGCGYWVNENWSVFTAFKVSYDITNFFYIKSSWMNFSLNVVVGIKYRF